MAFTDQAFAPWTADQIRDDLLDGPFQGFKSLQTDHYLILYQSSPEFARRSGKLLDSQYEGLLEMLRKHLPNVHEAEFPLVAIIFRDEQSFRAYKDVAPDILAYYNVISNHIYFYETSRRFQEAPDVAARKRPQTVAHEGTHQILQNIGVQPRLAPWPLWVTEGLAELFAPTKTSRDGGWSGGNAINPFHMATLKDLQDPLSAQLQRRGVETHRVGRRPGTPMIEYLVTRTDLTPTDYALAWALTYYLVNNRFEDFVKYLNSLSAMSPTAEANPDDHLAMFRETFGNDLNGIGKAIDKYLKSLKNFENLPYYAVVFEQPIGNGFVRRGGMISQSPAMIRQWLQEMQSNQGGEVIWQAWAAPTRSRAYLMAEQWMQSHSR